MIRCPVCHNEIQPGLYPPQAPMTFGINDTLEEIEFTFSITCPHCNNDLRVIEPYLWTGKCGIIPEPLLYMDQSNEDEDEDED